MIEFTSGDILTCEAEALVNTVNCVGVMGRGLALHFRQAFPENFKAYEAACQRKAVQPGRMFVFETGRLTPPRFIINFPTKRHWRNRSRIEDIEAGLVSLVEVIRDRRIRSIAIPPLGCGLGGLDWNDVRPRIERALASLTDVHVLIFEPDGAPTTDRMPHAREVPTMTTGRAAMVRLMQRYLDGLPDSFITLLEAHRLMYFMQAAGEPLRLNYVRHHYGPYAENLHHVLRAVEGYLIAGYADGGDRANKPLRLVPGAIEEATAFLDRHPESRARLERVSRLIEGFESSDGLELLSTVHWVMTQEGAHHPDEVVARVHAWNPPKRCRFSPEQMEAAIRRLQEQRWLRPDASPMSGPMLGMGRKLQGKPRCRPLP
jgi:O-acetyl-ADP-ribose deacetylase (regulator of RNase III)